VLSDTRDDWACLLLQKNSAWIVQKAVVQRLILYKPAV
jgi:hypothetical protein